MIKRGDLLLWQRKFNEYAEGEVRAPDRNVEALKETKSAFLFPCGTERKFGVIKAAYETPVLVQSQKRIFIWEHESERCTIEPFETP